MDVSLSLFWLTSASVHCSRYIPTHYKCLSSEFITATNMFVLHFGYQLITQGAMNIISCTCHFPKTKEIGNEHYTTQNMCVCNLTCSTVKFTVIFLLFSWTFKYACSGASSSRNTRKRPRNASLYCAAP